MSLHSEISNFAKDIKGRCESNATGVAAAIVATAAAAAAAAAADVTIPSASCYFLQRHSTSDHIPLYSILRHKLFHPSSSIDTFHVCHLQLSFS